MVMESFPWSATCQARCSAKHAPAGARSECALLSAWPEAGSRGHGRFPICWDGPAQIGGRPGKARRSSHLPQLHGGPCCALLTRNEAGIAPSQKRWNIVPWPDRRGLGRLLSLCPLACRPEIPEASVRADLRSYTGVEKQPRVGGQSAGNAHNKKVERAMGQLNNKCDQGQQRPKGCLEFNAHGGKSFSVSG